MHSLRRAGLFQPGRAPDTGGFAPTPDGVARKHARLMEADKTCTQSNWLRFPLSGTDHALTSPQAQCEQRDRQWRNRLANISSL
jgi:hypothetical protein